MCRGAQRIALLLGLALALPLLGGCASAKPFYAPDALRDELALRMPDVPKSEIVVPFEVDAASVERARAFVAGIPDAQARTRALVNALSSPKGFGLSYRWAVNNSAEHTLRDGGGNCLGLSSVLVGLARSLGLRAYYLDATLDPERHEEGGFKVAAGHIAVVVMTPNGPLFVDFTGELQRGWRYRRIDDLLAAAHYYNNSGYEIIHESTQTGAQVPWQEVQRQFVRATRIAPGLASAWNNIGVAAVQLGRFDQAERSYLRASALEPDFDSPRQNLASLRRSEELSAGLTHADTGVTQPIGGRGPLSPSVVRGEEAGVKLEPDTVDPGESETPTEATP